MLIEWTDLNEFKAEEAIGELLEFALIFEYHHEDKKQMMDYGKKNVMKKYSTLPMLKNFVRTQKKYCGLQVRQCITKRMLQILDDLWDDPNWPQRKTIDYLEDKFGYFEWAIEDSFDRNDYVMVIKMMRYLAYPLQICGRRDLCLRLGYLSYDAAMSEGLETEKARSLVYYISWVHFLWHQWREAKCEIHEALKILKKNPDAYIMAAAIRTIGLILKEKKKYQKAEKCLLFALKLFEKTDSIHFLAITYGSLGGLMRDINHHSKAEAYFEKGIEITRKYSNDDDTDSMMEIKEVLLLKIAKLYIFQGRLNEAHQCNKKAHEYSNRLGRKVGQAYYTFNEALISEKRGDLDKAYELIREASEKFDKHGSKKEVEEAFKRIRRAIEEE